MVVFKEIKEKTIRDNSLGFKMKSVGRVMRLLKLSSKEAKKLVEKIIFESNSKISR